MKVRRRALELDNTSLVRPPNTPRILVLASGVLMGGSLAVAAHYFPGSYDWPHRVISQVLAPRTNAAWYWLPVLGVGIGACLLFPVIGHLYQRARVVSPIGASSAAVGLVGGTLALIVSVLVPEQDGRLLNLVHQIFAAACTLGIEVGVLCCAWCAVKERCRIFGSRRWLKRLLALNFGLVTGLAFVGIAFGMGIPHPAIPAPFLAGLWQPMFWELGFWEWVWSAWVYLFLVCAMLL